jgi:hypothetical protein
VRPIIGKKSWRDYLISIQNRIARFMKELSAKAAGAGALEEAATFLRDDLMIAMPPEVAAAEPHTIESNGSWDGWIAPSASAVW